MQVVDLTDEYMHFVAACTHIDAHDEETERVSRVRESWLRDKLTKGLKVKVALDKGTTVGFAHCLPIELGTWGMAGRDLMTVPCLTLRYRRVYDREQGSGVGKALMEAVEAEAKKNKKGVAVLCYDNDFWFMPYAFFRKLGYKEVARQGETVIVLKAWEDVEPLVMHKLNYEFTPIKGKVVVDAFWHPICATYICEIQRVREVCAEYGDKVILNEYNCGVKDILDKYQTSRALFFNGKYKCWGHEAPRDGLRKVIDQAFKELH